MIPVKLELSTLSILIAGLYCTYSAVEPIGIPEFIWLKIATLLEPYMDEWDYEKHTFEDWVKYDLLIIPKALCTDEDIEHFKGNTVYQEEINGNAILIVTFEV